MYDRVGRRELAATIDRLRGATFDLGLSHGDLALRNIIVPTGIGRDAGPPALIGWGAASVGPVPFTDLMSLLRNRATIGARMTRTLLPSRQVSAWPWTRSPQPRSGCKGDATDLVRWALEMRHDLLKSPTATARGRLLGPRPWP